MPERKKATAIYSTAQVVVHFLSWNGSFGPLIMQQSRYRHGNHGVATKLKIFLRKVADLNSIEFIFDEDIIDIAL